MKTLNELKKGCKKTKMLLFYDNCQYEVSCGEISPISKRVVICETCEEAIDQQEEIIHMINDEYPDLPHEEDRRVFTEWKDKFKEKLIGGE